MMASSEIEIIELNDSDVINEEEVSTNVEDETNANLENEANANENNDDDTSVNVQINVDIESSKIEFVRGSRTDGESLYVVNEGQLYQKCTPLKQVGYWYRCRKHRKLNCRARVFYHFASKSITKRSSTHNHDNQRAEFAELKLSSSIKKDVTSLSSVNSSSTHVSEVFYRHCRE